MWKKGNKVDTDATEPKGLFCLRLGELDYLLKCEADCARMEGRSGQQAELRRKMEAMRRGLTEQANTMPAMSALDVARAKAEAFASRSPGTSGRGRT